MTTTRLSTRERILRSASQLFAIRGYYGTSTRDIAEAAGIRQPSLFHHFPTKDRIMAALHRLDLEPSAERAEQAVAERGNPAVRLHRYLVEDIRRLLEAPYDFVHTGMPATLDDPLFGEARVMYDRVQDAHKRLITEGMDQEIFLQQDLYLADRSIEWMISGLLLDSLRMAVTVPHRLASELADLILRMLLANQEDLVGIRSSSLPDEVSPDTRLNAGS